MQVEARTSCGSALPPVRDVAPERVHFGNGFGCCTHGPQDINKQTVLVVKASKMSVASMVCALAFWPFIARLNKSVVSRTDPEPLPTCCCRGTRESFLNHHFYYHHVEPLHM